jgi:drug/metabolite transporter (DMT)-like permease
MFRSQRVGRHRRRRAPWWRRRLGALLAAVGVAVVVVAGGGAASAATPNPTPPAAPGHDPIEVTPNWRELPGKDKIQTLLDVASQVGLACCAGSVIIGGAAMGIGRATGQTPGRAPLMVLGGGGGALLIEFAPDLINWLTQ